MCQNGKMRCSAHIKQDIAKIESIAQENLNDEQKLKLQKLKTEYYGTATGQEELLLRVRTAYAQDNPVQARKLLELRAASRKARLDQQGKKAENIVRLASPEEKSTEGFSKVLHMDNGIVEYWNDQYQIHRVSGPAIIYPNGTLEYHQNDELHREDGPAVEYPNGVEEYWQAGKLHRTDGPAIITPYFKGYYQAGELHRENGPAIETEFADEFWENGKFISETLKVTEDGTDTQDEIDEEESHDNDEAGEETALTH